MGAKDEMRNQLMKDLFGDQYEDGEEENYSDYQSDEGEGKAEHDGVGKGEAEKQREVEAESQGEAHDKNHDFGDSEEERVQSTPEKEVNDQQMESEGKETESEESEQRVVISHRKEVIACDSAEDNNHYPDHENEEETYSANMHSKLLDEQKNHDVIRRVFGDSDDEEDEYVSPNEQRSSMDEDGNGYGRDLRAEYRVAAEDAKYKLENKYRRHKLELKPICPTLELEVPLRRPPGQPERMSMVKVSNIMGIEPKPFDPKLYVEENSSAADEHKKKKHVRLNDNVVRWRKVKNNDGSTSIESNARFVKWSDGSTQLLIGNEVLDINAQEAHHDQTHLFLHHGKGILQSQGRISTKMRFMPSSIASKSHRSLTLLVDTCNKKVSKVKNCITDFDPEKEKDKKEKVEHKTIRANEILHRKREKVNRKYTQTFRRERQLSPGFLEDDPEEEDEPNDYYSLHRSLARYRFEEDLEAQAEKRIINSKLLHANKNVPGKTSLPAVRSSKRPADSERGKGKLKYGIDAVDIERSVSRERDDLPKYEDECEEEDEAADTKSMSEEEEEEPKQKKESGGCSLKHKVIEPDEDSPPRKTVTHRRKAVVFDSDED